MEKVQKSIPLKKAIIVIVAVSVGVNLVLGAVVFGILRATRPTAPPPVCREAVERLIQRTANNAVRIRTSDGARWRDGSGVIVDVQRDEDGYRAVIITGYHVVRSGRVEVALGDGGDFGEAVLVGAGDAMYDVAVIRTIFTVPSDFEVLTLGGEGERQFRFGEGGDIRIGQAVLSLGNAHGGGIIPAEGVVGQTRVNVDVGPPVGRNMYLIRITNNIVEGMSGGPAFDMDGRLIGINIASRAGEADLGYLVPVEYVRMIFDRIMGAFA